MSTLRPLNRYDIIVLGGPESLCRYDDAREIERDRDALKLRNEDLETRIASLTRLVDASELAIQERNNLIIDLKIRIEGLQREADDCLYLKMGFMYGAICWCQEAYVIGQERDDLRAQKYLLQDRIAELETEVAEIRGSTSFGKSVAIEQQRDALKYRVVELEAALRELVTLKKLRDTESYDEDYYTRKPLAWAKARALIGEKK